MIIISSKLVIQRIEGLEMELEDVTCAIVADNTDPVPTILVRCSSSPRGKPVLRICKVLLEVEKGVSLAFNATNLRVRSAEIRMNNEQTKEKG